ncbi:MAG: sigma 54-interacting transcriptional regulator [Myxococcota bacterium]|jgi:DNA-binding NtrC family response regulator|nr:sigma 54-interacting transcriptional regulator [Myxococcota bacterium]
MSEHIEHTAAVRPKETTLIYQPDGSALIETVQLEVRVVEGPGAPARCVLPDAGLTIGTSPACGFVLQDPSVSRQHLELCPEGDGVRVRDLGSTNGTLVSGSRITDAVVALGTPLHLGQTQLEVWRIVDQTPIPLSRRRRFGALIGSSVAMRQIYALLERAAETDVTVLLCGDTGTGKELAARALHDHSKRATGPFQIVDCGAVSPTLIEAELFGHERGAFTGADKERPGAFERASDGTLFFDEIGELPLNLQPKLLRALEAKEIQRIGGAKRLPVNVRFVAATNRDLAAEVKARRFREDLYYRLNVFRVTMPPLRQHPDDIPLLIEHFLGVHGRTLSADIVSRMQSLDWPGNVRELRNAVERAIVLAGAEAPSAPRTEGGQQPESDGSSMPVRIDSSRPFKDVKAELVESFEKAYIEDALQRHKGNISAAARESGIDRKHLERLIRKHGIDLKSLR